jgi:hypothetical protein
MVLIQVITGSIIVIAVTLIYGARRWDSATKEMHERLEAARVPIATKSYSAVELIGLPAPVQKYFRAVLKDRQPIVAAARFEQVGTFNMSATGENWKPFTSRQRVITKRPGFDWEARIEMMPGLTARVHDAYIGGEGMLQASLLGLVSMADLRGTPEMAQGEFMRYFAEAAWYPTAFLPSQGVQWTAVDDFSARATLHDGGNATTLLFRFDEGGLMTSMRAEARGRGVAGVMIPTPWEGKWSNYELRDGMRIPIRGEVAWMLPEGPKTYWRGAITMSRYEFAE